MIVYIDNILLMAEPKEQALDQSQAVVNLLECLGSIREVHAQTIELQSTPSTWSSNCPLAVTAPSQDKTDSSRASTANEDGGASLSLDTSTPTRQNELNEMCDSSCTPLLQKPASSPLRPSLEGTLALSPASLEELKWWDTEMSK